MRKFLFFILLSTLLLNMCACGKKTVSDKNTFDDTFQSLSAYEDNVEGDNMIIGVSEAVMNSDGIIEQMDSSELITKLSKLYEGMSLDDIISIFGKEPFMIKEANIQIFKYYSGDITIILWGSRLFQAGVEYEDSVVYISLE